MERYQHDTAVGKTPGERAENCYHVISKRLDPFQSGVWKPNIKCKSDKLPPPLAALPSIAGHSPSSPRARTGPEHQGKDGDRYAAWGNLKDNETPLQIWCRVGRDSRYRGLESLQFFETLQILLDLGAANPNVADFMIPRDVEVFEGHESLWDPLRSAI